MNTGILWIFCSWQKLPAFQNTTKRFVKLECQIDQIYKLTRTLSGLVIVYAVGMDYQFLHVRYLFLNETIVFASVCWFRKIRLQKWNYSGVKDFFPEIVISQISLKMNLRQMTKRCVADQLIRFHKKSIYSRFDLLVHSDSVGVNMFS